MIAVLLLAAVFALWYSFPIKTDYEEFREMDQKYHLRITDTPMLLSKKHGFSLRKGLTSYYLCRGSLNERNTHVIIEITDHQPLFRRLDRNTYTLADEKNVEISGYDVDLRLYVSDRMDLNRTYDLLFWNGYGYIRVCASESGQSAEINDTVMQKSKELLELILE